MQNKPEHFCADHNWAHLLPGDPRLESCQCTFIRDAEERAREVWRAVPATYIAGGWALRYGGATVGTDERGHVAYVAVDEPQFESTLVRDLITQLPFIVEGYVTIFGVSVFHASTFQHFTRHVAQTMNARLTGHRLHA